MADSTVTIAGNLTRNPELRFTQTGRARCVLGVAVKMNRQTNAWEEDVSFFNVVCWAETAENVSESLSKGDRVLVTGTVLRSWTTADDETRSVVEVVADDVAPSLRWAVATPVKTPRDGSPVRAAPVNQATDRRTVPVSEEPF